MPATAQGSLIVQGPRNVRALGAGLAIHRFATAAAYSSVGSAFRFGPGRPDPLIRPRPLYASLR
mgnify:CR=1 FL=1